MNGWEWGALAFVVTWFLGAVFAAGLLWEREHMLGNPTMRSWQWWFGFLITSMAWPWLLMLWGSSRPVPPQPGERVVMDRSSDKGWTFESMDLEVRTTWEWRGAVNENVGQQTGATPIDNPASLALCGRIQVGERVFVNSVGILLERKELSWEAVLCTCRYNFSGFPVVVCRQHRSDADPQGEPDESEGDVGL